jgi:hypothetical protein
MPEPVRVAFVQVAPSFVEYWTVTVFRPLAVEPGWSPMDTGIANVVFAAAVFAAFSVGRYDRLQMGMRTGLVPAVVSELNVHTPLIRVPNTTGALRSIDASSR